MFRILSEQGYKIMIRAQTIKYLVFILNVMFGEHSEKMQMQVHGDQPLQLQSEY